MNSRLEIKKFLTGIVYATASSDGSSVVLRKLPFLFKKEQQKKILVIIIHTVPSIEEILNF